MFEGGGLPKREDPYERLAWRTELVHEAFDELRRSQLRLRDSNRAIALSDDIRRQFNTFERVYNQFKTDASGKQENTYEEKAREAEILVNDLHAHMSAVFDILGIPSHSGYRSFADYKDFPELEEYETSINVLRGALNGYLDSYKETGLPRVSGNQGTPLSRPSAS